MGGCPLNSHCEYGFCECMSGYTKGNGQCYTQGLSKPARSYHNALKPCTDTACCQSQDINMVFNNESLAENPCTCRQAMKWNTKELECQFYMDVDCSSITYDNVPSTIVLAAANKTMKIIGDETTPVNKNNTITPDDALKNSLLSNIDPEVASEQELTEAFCRDVDSFSWEFGGLEKTDKGMFSNMELTDWLWSVAIIVIIVCTLVRWGPRMYASLKSCCYYDEDGNKDENDLNEITNNATTSTDPHATSLSAHTDYPPNLASAGKQQLPYPPATNETPYPTATNGMPYPPATNEMPYPPASIEMKCPPPATNEMPYPPATTEMAYPPATTEMAYPPATNTASYQPPAIAAPYPPPPSGQPTLPTAPHGLPYPVSPFQPSSSKEEPYIAPPAYNPSM